MCPLTLTAALSFSLAGTLAANLGRVPELSLVDPAGRAWPIRDPEAKAVVLVFLSTDCPVSNRYAPELARLSREWGRGVTVYGVHADPDVTPTQAARHATEYALPFPVLLDPTQRLARAAGVTQVPTAVVLSRDGTIRYRGRIDDRHTGVGKARAEPTRRDLAEAVAEVLAGKPVAVPRTAVVGCNMPPAGP